MKTPVRIAASIVAATATFFAIVLGAEFVTWFYAHPADPLSDPALNAARFAAAGAAAIGSAFVVWPRAGLPKSVR